MRASVLPVVLSLAMTLASGVSLAQSGEQNAATFKTVSDTPSLYSRLFQHPTNNNGYEELVQAADLVQKNTKLDSAITPGTSLTFLRSILADPAASHALALLREGLEKPIYSPRQHVDENTTLPELAPFRRLARLLCIQMRVDLLDGRTTSAIRDLRTGLMFGYHVQTDTLISGLIGVWIDANVLNEFTPHTDQLTSNQSIQVLHTVQEALDTECPAIRLLTQERDHMLKTLETRRSNPNSMLSLLDTISSGNESENGGNVEETQALQDLQDRLIDHPDQLNPIIDEAQARIVSFYNQAILNLRLPITQRKPVQSEKSSSPGFWLFRTVSVNMQPLFDKYDIAQEKLRLLGVHALIRHYQLEHNELPKSLTQLQAPALIQDPFTGGSLDYQRNGTLYTLSSQGPHKVDDKGRTSPSERTPVK